MHTYDIVGSYKIRLTVKDNYGQRRKASYSVSAT
jgi:PKD repeat protein